MSVYTKLQQVRADLYEMKLKKSGKNAYAGFEYFELGDFLPAVQKLNAKHGICPVFTQDTEKATLSIVDCDDPSGIISFTIPAAECSLSGKPQPIHNLGAQQTYLRRYLYLVAYEISENDVLDATTGKSENATPPVVAKNAPPKSTTVKNEKTSSEETFPLESAKAECRKLWKKTQQICKVDSAGITSVVEAGIGKPMSSWGAADYEKAIKVLQNFCNKVIDENPELGGTEDGSDRKNHKK